jgi:hypothetical protein
MGLAQGWPSHFLTNDSDLTGPSGVTDLPRLRKRPLEADAATSGRAANEIDIVGCTAIAYSSEDPAHPVENLLDG